jgi:hypothetical protein
MSCNVLGLRIICIRGDTTLGLSFRVERGFRVYHKYAFKIMGQ